MSYDVLNGELNGLFRVQMFHQDDDHTFLTEDMIEDERSKENSDESKITRLLFEQMLRGLYIR